MIRIRHLLDYAYLSRIAVAASRRGGPIVLLASLLAVCASLRADQPTSQPTISWPLASIPQIPDGNYSPAELAGKFPAFHHVPFNTGEFILLQLPLHYIDPNSIGDANDALAMSFFLSYAMDWMPGDYDLAQAFYRFALDWETMHPLEKGYDAARIAQEMKRWRANYAMGGTLTRQIDGYAAELLIFDRTGTVLFRKAFDKPRPYFDLLSDMSCAAMAYLGSPPSPALAAFLRKPQCSAASITDLGSTAYLNHASDEAFAINDKILTRDPDFGDLRHWSGVHKRDAEKMGGADYFADEAKAINSHLNLAAIYSMALPFEPHGQMLPGLNKARLPPHMNDPLLKQWIDAAEALIGPDAPTLLEIQLQPLRYSLPVSSGLISRGLAAAARYPDEFDLVNELGGYFRDESPLRDCDLAASLELAALQGFGSPDAITQAGPLGNFEILACQAFPQPDVCIQIMLAPEKRWTSVDWDDSTPADNAFRCWLKCLAYFQMGRFKDAARVAAEEYPADVRDYARAVPATGMLCCALTGDRQRFDAIQERYGQKVQDWNPGIVQVLDGMLDGRIPDPRAAQNQLTQKIGTYNVQVSELIIVQIDQLLHGHAAMGSLLTFAKQSPANRLLWFLYDRYQTGEPSTDAKEMYEVAAWLKPEDPWVQQMVAVRHPSCDEPQALAQVKALIDQISAWSDTHAFSSRVKKPGSPVMDITPEISPWHVAHLVHALLNQHQIAAARALAAAYDNVPTSINMEDFSIFTRHLVHMTDTDSIPNPPIQP